MEIEMMQKKETNTDKQEQERLHPCGTPHRGRHHCCACGYIYTDLHLAAGEEQGGSRSC